MKEAAYSAPKLKAEINENQLKHFKKVEGESYFGPQIFLPSLTEAEKKPERCSLKERLSKEQLSQSFFSHSAGNCCIAYLHL